MMSGEFGLISEKGQIPRLAPEPFWRRTTTANLPGKGQA